MHTEVKKMIKTINKINRAATKYHGKPCLVCGETLRYRKSRRCVECKGRIDHENYLARKEAAQ